MNGIQNRRTWNAEKAVPGCLGRVANFFDLSTGIAGNRLLTDKPHFDGFGHSKRQSDAVRISPIGDALDDEVVASELTKSSSHRYFNGTSVKMLMAEEMSKELELKHNSPNLVAKLMGLDTLPQKQPDSVVKISHSRSYSGSNIGLEMDSWQQEHRSLEQNGYKEFSDMTWQSRKRCYMRDKLSDKGRCVEASNDKKMALVRQKFSEAKNLATNEKLRQSKRFQDAVEVLSSNRGLLLKLLQEQNSFSQKLPDLHCDSPPPEAKRITVLRPSKILDVNQIPSLAKKKAKPTNKAHDVCRVNKLEKRNHAFAPPSCHLNEGPTQRTRIVVLKPSGKFQDMKAVVSPSPSFSTECGKEMYGDPFDDNVLNTGEMAKRITHQLDETLSETSSEHLREETLDSSIFSNGYNGDESSFHKSDNEFTLGNLSDSEVVTPTSGNSWDYINRFERPFGSSSFSHVSCSPESSVCREAKKRLSERWALMASNGNCQEQKHLKRGSSTLGEMLALSDTKMVAKSEEEVIIGEEEMRLSPLCSTSNVNIDQFVNESPINLLRSKSVPASSTLFSDNPNRVSDPKVGKADTSKEITKTTTPKSSFKEKISGLFFSRNKRPGNDKSSSFQSKHESEEPAMKLIESHEEVSEAMCKGSGAMVEDPLETLQGSPDDLSSQDPIGLERKLVNSPEAKLCVAKPVVPRIPGESQDQPSPVSVLEPPFEEDETITTDSSNVESDKYGLKLLPPSNNSCLINKSPSIESIARTLSWEDPCLDTATSYTLKPSRVSQGSEEEEEEGLLFLVKSLLSAAGFDGDVASESLFYRWHSPENPLDPSLRDSYFCTNDKDIMHEAMRGQKISTGKLVFDCVNTALVDIVDCNLAKSRSGVCGKNLLECAPSLLADEVWACVKEWFPCEVPEDFLSDDWDSSSLVIEATARKEVLGNVWTARRRLEIDNVGKEIEVILVAELVQELLVEFSDRV